MLERLSLVSTNPGATALHRIPASPSSTAMPLVSPATAAFIAA